MGSGAPIGGYDTNTRQGLLNAQASPFQSHIQAGGIDAAQKRLDDASALAATPDLTDDAVKKAKLAAQQKLLEGQGFGQMFLTGPLGINNSKPTPAPAALGAPKAP